jgi:hypothetical protein
MYRFGGWDVRMTSILDVLAKHSNGGHLYITKILLFVVLLFFVTFSRTYWKLKSETYSTECNRIQKYRKMIECNTHQQCHLHSVSHFRNSFVNGMFTHCCLLFSPEMLLCSRKPCIYSAHRHTWRTGWDYQCPKYRDMNLRLFCDLRALNWHIIIARDNSVSFPWPS